MGGRAPPLVELPKRILVADRGVLGHCQRVPQLVPKQRDQFGGGKGVASEEDANGQNLLT